MSALTRDILCHRESGNPCWLCLLSTSTYRLWIIIYECKCNVQYSKLFTVCLVYTISSFDFIKGKLHETAKIFKAVE